MSLRCLLAFVFALVAGSATAKPPYVLAGVAYNSAEQVFTAYRAAWGQQMSQVQRGQYFGGSVLVVLPPDSALITPAFIAAYRPDFDQDSKRVYQRWYQESAQVSLEAINKAGFFDSATLTRVQAYWKYASDFGYRYILVYVGRPDGLKLADSLTREEVVVKSAGEGLAGMMNGIESALDQLGRGVARPTIAGAAPAPAAMPAVTEAMQYDEQTRKGWVSISGRGLEARSAALKRIAEICATKNKLLVSDDLAASRGAFKVLDEELKDGVLKISFEALY